MNRRSLLLLAAILAAVAVLLAVSGGVRATVGGFRLSARSPTGVSVAAVVAAAAWWALARRAKAVNSDLESAWSNLERNSSSVIAGVAAVSGIVAATFATNSASGADASGYLSEAALWASFRLFQPDALVGVVGAADPWLTSPLGWRPSPVTGLQSPTYPAGLPLLMAIPHALGGTTAAASVVTLSAALTVWATGQLARSIGGGATGVIAAFTLAVCPIFLFQSMQPMSDVPVTSAWMLVWLLVLRQGSGIGEQGSGIGEQGSGIGEQGSGTVRVALAGVLCALAVLIRPNLAPLAAVPLFAIGANFRRLAAFSLPVVIAGVLLMFLQNLWYGSPLRSGYGTADQLFALSNISANTSRYLSWLMTTAPVLLLAPGGVILLWRQAFTKWLALFSALVVAAYLVYAVFDVWSYLRFLLPALAVAAGFAGAALAEGLNRLPRRARLAGALVVILGISAHGVSQARSLDTFRLAEQQKRVAQVAEFISTTLPQDTVIVSGEQSGSLRYYTGRSILRWDAASPDALAGAIAALSAAGRPVLVALDAWEREPFRAKVSALASVSLEWPAAFEAGTSHRTQVWRLSDRDAFLRGESVATQRLP